MTADTVVVESVAGFRVPLRDDFDTADLARQLALPVVIMVDLRLGCISHALLTAEAIAARGLPAPLPGVIPRLQEKSPAALPAAVHLDFSSLPNWPGAGEAVPAATSHPFSPEAKEA